MQEIRQMLIEDRIEKTIDTLYSIDKGELYRAHDIYNLTTHVGRYSILNYVLSILSMPLLVVSGIVKFCSGGMVAINQVINIPDIFKDKMDQAITKKILYGLKKVTSDELSDITSTIAQSILLNQFHKSILFVFRGKQADKIKILWWDGQGFCLYYKCLDNGKFTWPKVDEKQSISITKAQLSMLIEAIDWRNPRWSNRPEYVG